MQHPSSDFHEVLAEQMRRAPYLLASLLIHAIAGLILAGVMLLKQTKDETPVIAMQPVPPPPQIEDPPKPPEPDPVDKPEITEPTLVDAEIEPDAQPLEDSGDPQFNSESVFDDVSAVNSPIGIGGPPGGNLGERGGSGGGGGAPTEKAVQGGLKWLRDHQSPDGYWDADDFMAYDRHPGKPASDGKGSPTNDVGLTGLALLAFLGNGHTTNRGEHREVVARGVNWLRNAQDMANGLIGAEVGNPTLYNHAIATMALGEAYYFSKSPILRRNVHRATSLILNAQNPYNAWRYSLEPNNDNDTSITGWMVFALKTAEDGGIAVPKDAYRGALEWFNTMTDPGTGRTGYAFGDGGGKGGPPSRIKIYLERFPPEKSEALTAVSLLCREFLTDTSEVRRWQDHPNYDLLKKQADLIASKPPEWDEEGGSCDMYYWYYATFAMNQWGGQHWRDWKKSIEAAILPEQHQGNDNFTGSWDPVGPWGDDGGRVYSTAICTLILEVYYRYARVLGAR